MKRIALALSLLVVGGTASAAIFVPTPEPAATRAPVAKIGSMVPSSAPDILDARRAPVPLMRLPKPDASAHIASLTEPPPDFSQIQVKPARAPAVATKASIESNPHKAVRDLTSDGSCKGRTLTSVRVEPDGRVTVQC